MPRPFIPDFLPLSPERIEEAALIQKLGEANRALSLYSGMVQWLPNPDLFLSSMRKVEAVQSSRIEGTQATIDDVYAEEAGAEYGDRKSADIAEVANYCRALKLGADSIESRGVTLYLLKEMHYMLLQGVRGENKTPGEFRMQQNWIGDVGSTIETATYVPPNPVLVPELLENWLSYFKSEEKDPLIQTAVLHAQFESIHPFLDVNGRMGRLLIPLILQCKGVLRSPVFYLSSYLEAHRDEYYSCLEGTHRGRWTEWVLFFLDAVATQARENISLVKKMRDLHDRLLRDFREVVKAGFERDMLNALFVQPVFTIRGLSRQMPNCSERSVRNATLSLVRKGLLKEQIPGAGRRPARYELGSLMALIR